jgi:alkanesulfonate monooxygenase SsuD/methylene tetrahydromethanopterin reductase-like flavin-dependent oxidoreductase (luciferase family)
VGRRCSVRQPALDAFTLLAALAGRTEPVLLGTACMGSFALRDPRVFAYEWASLDVLSHGRTRLSVCSGGGGGAWDAETAAMDIPPAERRRRMIENVHVLRHLWTRDNEPFEGRFIRFSGITLEPKPVQAPCPIWLTTNAARLSSGQSGTGGSALALERVGRVADGWMTHSVSPAEFRRSWAVILAAVTDAGRAIAGFDNVLCHHVNINEDRDAALADGKQFLDLYYAANYSRERLEAWLAYGSPRDVVAQLQRYAGSGCSRVTVRLATMGDAMAQLRRLTEEVLPCEPVHTSSGIRQWMMPQCGGGTRRVSQGESRDERSTHSLARPRGQTECRDQSPAGRPVAGGGGSARDVRRRDCIPQLHCHA